MGTTNHSLMSVGRRFEDRLNWSLLSSSHSLLPHIRSSKDDNLKRNLHQCPGYLREEIALTCDLSKSVIVSHAFPGPSERCSICHQLVQYTYSDSIDVNSISVSDITCKLYKVGSCTAGFYCRFSHSTGEPGVQKGVCVLFVKGNCKFGNKCGLAHILPGQSIAMDRKNKKAARSALAASASTRPGSEKAARSGEVHYFFNNSYVFSPFFLFSLLYLAE
jgi:hypothetical protein